MLLYKKSIGNIQFEDMDSNWNLICPPCMSEKFYWAQRGAELNRITHHLTVSKSSSGAILLPLCWLPTIARWGQIQEITKRDRCPKLSTWNTLEDPAGIGSSIIWSCQNRAHEQFCCRSVGCLQLGNGWKSKKLQNMIGVKSYQLELWLTNLLTWNKDWMNYRPLFFCLL